MQIRIKKERQKRCSKILQRHKVLSDKEKRAIYDQYGEDGLKGNANMSTGDSRMPEEVFARFFTSHGRMGGVGGMGGFFDDDILGMAGDIPVFKSVRSSGSMGSRPPKPKSYEMELRLTLEEIYNGGTKRLKVTRVRWKESSGKMTALNEEKVVHIDIKPGWKDGTRITFNGEGNQESYNSQPGDIVFIVKAKPHDRFVRDGNHLMFRQRITLLQALTGFRFPITPLRGGDPIMVSMDEIVSPQRRKILPNEGMPVSKRPGEKGDLIIEFDIEFPKSLNASQKAKLKETLSS